MAEIALRWMSHHSLMRREFGDSVLIGASGLAHIEQVRLRAFFPKDLNYSLYPRTCSTSRRARYVSSFKQCITLSYNRIAGEVVEALNEAWLIVASYAVPYFH